MSVHQLSAKGQRICGTVMREVTVKSCYSSQGKHTELMLQLSGATQ